MRYFLLVFGLVVIAVMVVAGKRGDMSRRPPIELFPDMDRQPKLRPQEANSFFKDGLSSQQPVAGTIARGSPWQDSPENTGKIPATTNWVQTIPFPVTAQLLKRGQERFNISCAPCHGAQGDGKGITTRFGMTTIGDLHDAVNRKVPQQFDGEIFNTISYGKQLMQGYAANITIQDRWAIVAYVRALQLSHLASTNDVPADQRAALLRPLPPAPIKK
ncbi:MAG TPA: cytochrome c [Anaerolineales bacterium]|jgi:mono/diheme cytochrome c family protein